MPKAYPMALRKAAARLYDECGSSAEVAEQLGVSEAWVRRLVQRRRETGSLEPLPEKRPDNNKLAEADLKALRELVERTPDLTLEELAAELEKGAGKKVSVPTLWRATQRLELPLKKRPSTPVAKPASRTART